MPGYVSRTIVDLTDYLDGMPAAETLRFGLDVREYEIDLSEKNAKALRKFLEPWTASARRVSGRRGTRGPASRVETGVDNAAVRAWAASNGIELSAECRQVIRLLRRHLVWTHVGLAAGEDAQRAHRDDQRCPPTSSCYLGSLRQVTKLPSAARPELARRHESQASQASS